MLRSILWNAPSSVTLHALKRQIKGCDVSGDLAFLGWLAFHGRSANQRIRQMAGCGKWHDRGHFTVIISENAAFERTGCHFTINLQITWCGNLHDRAFHARSTNDRTGPFHATAELLANVVHTSVTSADSWPSFSTCSSFLATVSWLVKFLRFAISYFVFHDTVCDWSKTLI